MTCAVSVRGAAKIFGRRIQQADEMMAGGAERTDVIAATGATPALYDVSLDFEDGKTTVVLGLSGCGKSTLLRLLNRLITPSKGQVEVDGEDIQGFDAEQLRTLRRKRIAMVFQQFGLLPHRSVRENVGFGLEIQGLSDTERAAEADKWIEAVGLSGFADALPAALSGGMRQRVGLARALATGAGILLMDEPFSALDPLTREEMQNLLIDLQRDMKKTIVFVTHDVTEAFRLGDKLAILQDARLVQSGTPIDLLTNPQADYVRQFMGNLDLLKGVSVAHILDAETPKTPGPSISAQTPIGQALTKFDGETDNLCVTADDGAVLGTVSLQSIQGLIRSVS